MVGIFLRYSTEFVYREIQSNGGESAFGISNTQAII
jgi:hypothetical protein